MQIYSLNARYNVNPDTYEAEVTAGVAEFTSVVLPVDGNEAPLAVFVLQVDSPDAVSSVRINGLVPEQTSGAIDVNGISTLVFAVRFTSPSYAIVVQMDDDNAGTAKLVGYSYGNVASLTTITNSAAAYSTDEDTIALAGPGALPANDGVMLFSLFAMGTWAEYAGTVADVSATGLSFNYPVPAGNTWPDDAVQVGDNISRVAVAISTSELATLDTTTWSFTNQPAPVSYDATVINLLAYAVPDSDEVSFNCECDDETSNETLSGLRTRLLIRLGYAAQTANPPQGMALLLDDFIRSGQAFLYNKFDTLRTERFYTWTMTPGVRFYDLDANEDACTKRMNAYKVSWVGVSDLNNCWLPMAKGIPPTFYTAVNYNGIPSRYEIRQCIEVFPPPASGYKLRIKAHFGLAPMVDDTDQTTIDSELVFLWALANAKAHYGQPDADNIAAQANTYLGNIVAGSHETARYVPGTRPALSVPAPVFLPLIGP